MEISSQYLKALLEISQEINSIIEPESLLDSMLRIAIRELGAERGFIILQEENDWNVAAVHGIPLAPLKELQEISHTTLQMVLEKKEPVLTFDTFSEGAFDAAQSIIMHEIRSIAIVPLILRGNLEGALYIDSRGRKAGFTKESLDFLQAFANQAVIALENARLLSRIREENAILKEEFHRLFAFKEIVGSSKTMQRVFQLMGKVLNNDTTVLILGETGTGKEVVARAIHFNGWRKGKPFVAVNCGAIPENLIESELFGHRKGAFTGAVADKKGLVEAADGGTLFLDEVGELPLSTQVKLLRFLQEQEFQRLGEIHTRKTNVRVIAATNRDLQQMIKEGSFREDLYYRLNVISIAVPPLRERIKDIPLLANFFLKKFAVRAGKDIRKIDHAALKKLESYHWPGNVRELENTMERAVVLCSGDTITEEDLMLMSGENGSEMGISAGQTLQAVSRELLRKTLQVTDGNRKKAAEMMGVSLRWVQYKMKEWGIDVG